MPTPSARSGASATAFVLGGGGVLGASEVGMLRALLEAGLLPDLVVGTSVGAVNGAVLAAEPTSSCIDTLTGMWLELSGNGVFSSGLTQLRQAARSRTHLHPIGPLRELLDRELGALLIEDLPVPFQC